MVNVVVLILQDLNFANMRMQYTCTAIFHFSKNDNFQMKNCDIFINLLKSIDH